MLQRHAARLAVLPPRRQQLPEVAERDERVWVLLAQRLLKDGEGLSRHGDGFRQLPLRLKEQCEVGDRRKRLAVLVACAASAVNSWQPGFPLKKRKRSYRYGLWVLPIPSGAELVGLCVLSLAGA